MDFSQAFIYRHFGALLLGSFFASTLSGAVFVQAVIYLRLFTRDPWSHKLLVIAVAILDILHTSLTWASMWDYLIVTFGQVDSITFIYWAISISIAVTAVLTICVHMFYAYRIWRLSENNMFMTLPIVVVACLRLVSALGTTSQMLKYSTFAEFRENVQWIFTLGLALSSFVDIIITISMFILLKASQKKAPTMVSVLDTLILYVFETGCATSAATIASMICWIAMHDNLAFLALHFVISKLYAISLLVMLNTRNSLRKHQRSWSGEGGPVIMFGSVADGRGTRTRQSLRSTHVEFQHTPSHSKPLQIAIHRSIDVECDSGEDGASVLREPKRTHKYPGRGRHTVSE